MHAYERWVALRYLARVLATRRFTRLKERHDELFAWIDEHGPRLRIPSIVRRPNTGHILDSLAEEKGFKARWKEWRVAVFAQSRAPAPSASALQNRIDWLCEACSLNASQRLLLQLFARIALSQSIGDLVAAANDHFNYGHSATLHFDAAELRPMLDEKIDGRDLAENGLLMKLGFIDSSNEFRLSDLIARILGGKTFSPPKIRRELLGPSARANLSWDDFDHLGEARDFAARLVAEGKAGVNTGAVNILIHGAPGTGKSEFARTLGAHLGFTVRFVGEADDRQAEPNRRDRIAALMLANAIGPITERLLIVVDEADDLFTGVDEDDAVSRQGSKVFMNRLVEKGSVPTIWITNDLHRMGPAVIRRMNLVMRLPQPGLKTRRAMVERIARQADFRLDAVAARKLAYLPAAPALIENAIRSASRINGSGHDALTILKTGLSALGRDITIPPPVTIAFDPALSSADVDLNTLATRVASAPTRALSFLLSGTPGTGKSAYARYLAETLELEVMERRYSDLSSMYLGESEKAIARAFEEAADLRAFLILDEADSLLRDRAAARNSWEITQVNEMLTWMERHPFPFACTTNAPDLLDPATARRFLFKVRFLPMNPEQIAIAFHRSFGLEAPDCTLKLDDLTPGDFAIVSRKAGVLGERNASRLAAMLTEEVEARPGRAKRRIGF